MKVFLNGFPKSGNHALHKAVELLGVPIGFPVVVNHEPFNPDLMLDATHYVFIKRDPRNVVISMLRMNKQPVTEGMFITRFRQFQQRSLVKEMAEFEPWLHHRGVLTIRYEDLISDDKVMRRLADSIPGAKYFGDHKKLPGMTKTWRAEHSDYRAVWSADIERVWVAEGGLELLARWGY